MNPIIYILRHERRPLDNSTYFVELTDDGKLNAQHLADRINELDVDVIYCSPFLRTIQTALPYCKKFNKKIKIEYSLYEYIDQTIFNSYTYKHSHKELYEIVEGIEENIDDSYTSFLDIDRLNYKEFMDTCYNRVVPFIDHLLDTHKDKKILLLSHGTILGIIKKYLEKGGKFTKEEEHLGLYPKMGELTKIEK